MNGNKSWESLCETAKGTPRKPEEPFFETAHRDQLIEASKTHQRQAVIGEQQWSKNEARLKQDWSITQAGLKQDSSKTASWGRKTFKNHYVFHQSGSKRATFKENPCVKMQKTKKSSKTIMIYMKNCQKGSFSMRILVWKRKKEAGEPWVSLFRGGPQEPISRRK